MLSDALKKYNAEDLLDRVSYEHPTFLNEDRLFFSLEEIITHNCRILIHGDPDVDGAFSVKILEDSLRRLGYNNFEIYPYETRSHTLTARTVDYIVTNHFNYVIILDSSSNSLSTINQIINSGTKVIIIDHHVCDYAERDFPSDCILVNCTVDNKVIYNDDTHFLLSAGALSFCLMAKFLESKGFEYVDLSAYALATLYSDCIDMSNRLNRSIYYLATSLDYSRFPNLISCLLTKTTRYCRRFIEFSYAPLLNALFRAEEFSTLNRFLFSNPRGNELSQIIQEMKLVRKSKREMVNKTVDLLRRKVLNLDTLIIANLADTGLAVGANKLYNYTGLIANELSDEFNKPCIVCCTTLNGIKSSFRDLYNRDYLRIFKQFADAKGHPAAFAIHIPRVKFPDFIYTVKNLVDKQYKTLGIVEPEVFDYETPAPNLNFLKDLALINEFTGNRIPTFLLNKKIDSKVSSRKLSGGNRIYTYSWGTYALLEGNRCPAPGSVVKVKPIIATSRPLKLLIYHRLGDL